MENESQNTTSEVKKSGRGGARAGAGRKKTGRKKIFYNHTISGSYEEIEMIKRKAAENHKSVSRFIIDLVKNS